MGKFDVIYSNDLVDAFFFARRRFSFGEAKASRSKISSLLIFIPLEMASKCLFARRPTDRSSFRDVSVTMYFLLPSSLSSRRPLAGYDEVKRYHVLAIQQTYKKVESIETMGSDLANLAR